MYTGKYYITCSQSKAYEAVEASGVDIAEIGAVIVATSTADNAFPSTAKQLYRRSLDWQRMYLHLI